MSTTDPVVIARIKDYRETFGTQAGRRVLSDLRRSYGKRPSYVKGDAYDTAFKEGERSVYLKIESMLNLSEKDLDRWTEELKHQEEENG